MVEQKSWTPNFSPGSTAREIVSNLAKQPHLSSAEDFLQRLKAFKDEAGLDSINVLQLQEYAQFEAGLTVGWDRQVRERIANFSQELIAQRGILL